MKAPTYALAAGSVMVLTMLTTYTFCVHQHQCPALPHLPTISNTWDNIPGNFLSRFVVNHVALAMALLQWTIFTPRLKTTKCAKFSLGAGVLACFFLSIVGAICDSSNGAECQGEGVVHSVSAVLFFILYNINMILVSCDKKKRTTSTCHHNLMRLLTVLSTLLKIRFILPRLSSSFAFGDQTYLALFEWTDTFLIIGWSVFYVWKNRQNWSIELQIENDNQRDEEDKNTKTTAIRFSIYNITWVVLLLFFSTLGICYYFIKKQGGVPAGSFPYISDMFVHKPGNWISRWTLVFGSTLSGFGQVCLYHMDNKKKRIDQMLTGLSLFAILGLSIVGCVNEKELHWLHFLGAGMFFGGYDLFMILRTLRLKSMVELQLKWKIVLALLCFMSCACTFLRYCPSGPACLTFMFSEAHIKGFLLPVIEWIDALTIILYMAASLFSYGKSTAQNIGLAIVSSAEPEEEEEEEEGMAVPLTLTSRLIRFSV